MEAVDKRALFLALTVTVALAFDRADFTSQYGRGWEVTIYIVGLLALAAAAALLACAVAPQTVMQLTEGTRERLLFIAFALTAGALLQQGLLRAYETYWAHKHGTTF